MRPQYSSAEGLGEMLAQDAGLLTRTQGQTEMLVSHQRSHTARPRPLPTSCKPQELQVAKARGSLPGTRVKLEGIHLEGKI